MRNFHQLMMNRYLCECRKSHAFCKFWKRWLLSETFLKDVWAFGDLNFCYLWFLKMYESKNAVGKSMFKQTGSNRYHAPAERWRKMSSSRNYQSKNLLFLPRTKCRWKYIVYLFDSLAAAASTLFKQTTSSIAILYHKSMSSFLPISLCFCLNNVLCRLNGTKTNQHTKLSVVQTSFYLWWHRFRRSVLYLSHLPTNKTWVTVISGCFLPFSCVFFYFVCWSCNIKSNWTSLKTNRKIFAVTMIISTM